MYVSEVCSVHVCVCLPPHDSHCQILMRIFSLPSAAGATLGPAGSPGDVPCSACFFVTVICMQGQSRKHGMVQDRNTFMCIRCL